MKIIYSKNVAKDIEYAIFELAKFQLTSYRSLMQHKYILSQSDEDIGYLEARSRHSYYSFHTKETYYVFNGTFVDKVLAAIPDMKDVSLDTPFHIIMRRLFIIFSILLFPVAFGLAFVHMLLMVSWLLIWFAVFVSFVLTTDNYDVTKSKACKEGTKIKNANMDKIKVLNDIESAIEMLSRIYKIADLSNYMEGYSDRHGIQLQLKNSGYLCIYIPEEHRNLNEITDFMLHKSNKDLHLNADEIKNIFKDGCIDFSWIDKDVTDVKKYLLTLQNPDVKNIAMNNVTEFNDDYNENEIVING